MTGGARSLAAALIAAAIVACSRAEEPSGPAALARLDHDYLPEASGMTVSGFDPRRLWFINDSGNAPELIAFDLDTQAHRRVEVDGIKNRDWEDLAAFPYRGEPWLAIGDIGDNDGKRGHIRVYLLPEPKSAEVGSVEVHSTIRLDYPDKARDAESMAVDALTQTLYILSKREKYPRLYRVALPALEPGSEHELVLSRLGKLRSIPAPGDDEKKRFKYGENRAQPTSMTFLQEQRQIAVLTYGGAYIAALADDNDWYRALNERLCALPTPELSQGETIAADAEGRIYVSSEGKRAPVYQLNTAICTAPDALSRDEDDR
ncbi:MAG: hypothetical protein V2I82_08845 [Halieaceae bacterium]|nr:hypothetical protein [Halieaceae bacterium]